LPRDAKVVFEAFEVSATAPAVLETNCALEWTFPSRSVSISASEFGKSSFQDALAEFLEQANAVAFDQFAVRAFKGGEMVVESRDTPSPALITEMLMSFLEATGTPSLVQAVHKRVRDDVVLGSSATPWRRSPYWLALRVAVQRILLTACNGDLGVSRTYFKFLMCVVFARLLSDCHTTLHPEKALMLQAKLCRRLAKLQNEMSEAPDSLQQLYGRGFSKTRSFFESTLAEAKRKTSALWDAHKRRETRSIPLLPPRASESDMVLKLFNSGSKLQKLLDARVDAPTRQAPLGLPSIEKVRIRQLDELATSCAEMVDPTSEAMSTLNSSTHSPQDKCVELSEAMILYMDASGEFYPTQTTVMSEYLLNLFELWVAMDSLATDICSILRDYHPGFAPEALDVLCLMTRHDMERLRRVQRYILGRIKSCKSSYGTIFSSPHSTTAFATSYFNHGEKKSDLHSLSAQIEAASAKSELLKKRDLHRLMSEYERLSVDMERGVCRCTLMPDGSLNVDGCKRCWKARCRKRLKVMIHEAFLPQDESHKAAVLLELRIPRYLAAYRDATWRLRILGSKDIPTEDGALQLLLEDFGPLQEFRDETVLESSVTLASRQKSFLLTHYRELKLPTSEEEVLLPFGAVFTYYDADRDIWADDCREVPWYHHLLGSWLPEREHPSSYDIAAGQDTGPQDMSPHEFAAFQRAISGVDRRWIVLVFELGSTNLSLSDEMTRDLFTRLALQSGPANLDQSSDILGKVHQIFQDVAFCEKLEHQIQLHLNALDSGRRDLVCMSILTTLSLRLHHLCPSHFRPNVGNLLRKIRELLSLWISQLREEVRSTENGETALKASCSAFWASLLCRQTFETFLTAGNESHFGEEEANHFFRASIALSESISNESNFSTYLIVLFAQDMSRAHSMRDKIREWTLANFSALRRAINDTWIDAGSLKPRSFSNWNFLEDEDWVTSTTIATSLVASQTIHYHPIRGHLLIDGKPLDDLPLEIREDKSVLELFQGQHLLARPSGLAGMEYQIVNSIKNHDVHVGLEKGRVVIRAKFRGQLLEHVPREVFRGNETSDLPSGLVDGCQHWLNLHTGELEMRRKPNIWVSKASNWVLDVQTRIAMRQHTTRPVSGSTTGKRGARLVEPQSEIGRHIMHIFQDFETPGNLTIFQPLSDVGRLSVEIKRLEMAFFVNCRGLLQSNQLHSEIDPVQDIGTLHGLKSKLVLRNTSHSRRKSVMIPFGSVSWQRQGPHVSVRIVNEGSYALFTVDTLLGRLSCAPEPNLFYLKALVHALTSFPIPDELTGRTGTEEARLCLTAAQSQPWKPLSLVQKRILSVFLGLGPKRKFYPADKMMYQKVVWDNGLTATIQHEQLAIHAGDILRQSQTLDIPEKKATDKGSRVEMELPDLHHLALRGIIRRQLYERRNTPSDLELLSLANESKEYIPRITELMGSIRVYRAIRELREGSGRIPELDDLGTILQSWPVIDGFTNTCGRLNIHQSLNAEASQAFGPFIKSLVSSDGTKDYIAQLRLALLAFCPKINTEVIVWMVAFANNCTLRDIEPPKADRFTDFNPVQRLGMSHIMDMVESAQDSHATYIFNYCQNLTSPRTKKPADETEYELGIVREAKRLTSWLKKAWPDIPLTQSGFETACKALKLRYVNPVRTWTRIGPELNCMSQHFALSVYLKSVKKAAREIRSDCGGFAFAIHRGRHAVMPNSSTTWINLHAPRSPKPPYQIPSLAKLLRSSHGWTELLSRGSQLPQPCVSKAFDRPKDYNILGQLASISTELSMLHEIVQPFKSSQNLIHQQYGQDLEDSIEAMAWDLQQFQPQTSELALSTESVKAQIEAAERGIRDEISLIRKALSDQDSSFFWLEAGHLWPCDSLVAMLEQLRHDNYKHLALKLKESLVNFGILVTKLQRLLRIHDAERCRDENRLLEEQNSTGHSNWSPMDYPEWLLLEIDNNILIRPVQVEVAKAIISPGSNQNSVLQMNMGKGKQVVRYTFSLAVL
jgi:hypothetical protein